MKRILFLTLMFALTAASGAVRAQKNRQYDDDIYGGKPRQTTQEEPPASTGQNTPSDEPAYRGSGNSAYANTDESGRQYNSDDYYYSDDDDYYYSSSISRFNYPFYNRPYWSSFYNPYWYDPYWVDPYWGWSPWTRPGLTVSVGFGPYWSSYWGWNSWYGYPGWGSYWGYPAYGLGYGWGGGYYSGYWNGYYAGLYNGDGFRNNRRSITYGPRYTLRPTSNMTSSAGGRPYNGFRTAPDRTNAGASPAVSAPSGRNDVYRTPFGSSRDMRGNEAATGRDNSSGAPARPVDRPVRNGWQESSTTTRQEAQPATPATAQPREERGSWFERGNRQSSAPAAGTPAPPQQQRRETAPAQPRYESAPARSFDRGGFGGGRSFGGSGGGGGFGGGSGGGGGRRR